MFLVMELLRPNQNFDPTTSGAVVGVAAILVGKWYFKLNLLGTSCKK